MKIFLLSLLISVSAFAGESEISKTILNEYKSLRAFTETLKEDYTIGGFTKAKEYPDTLLMWELDDDFKWTERIRFYREREDGTSFAVTYVRSSIIVRGRIVLRRFVGTEPTGWVNHTIDYETGEYLGQQGWNPVLTDSEIEMLSNWKIAHPL